MHDVTGHQLERREVHRGGIIGAQEIEEAVAELARVVMREAIGAGRMGRGAAGARVRPTRAPAVALMRAMSCGPRSPKE